MADCSDSETPLGKKKRARRGNFSPGELEVLVNEVEIRIGIINSKFCDVITNKKKKRAWEEIARAVSKQGTVDRTGEEVSIKFTKMKSEAKKKKGYEIKERNKTGGGPAEKIGFTHIEERLLQLMGKSN